LLPSQRGVDYPDHALAVPRHAFDARLFAAAVNAGAMPVRDRVTALVGEARNPLGVHLAAGGEIAADVVIGADGATSTIAQAAGLLDAHRTLWGFALRSYVDAPVELPHIVLWEPATWRIFPGYGWIFPGPHGMANIGLGLAVGANRAAVRQASERFPDFIGHLSRLGLLPRPRTVVSERLGGWLKMGLVGTVPGRGRVLLVGDAAGLINPLQGEGIAQAMASGQAAARAIVDGGAGDAVNAYRAWLQSATVHHRINAAVQAGTVRHPRVVSLTGRALTTPPLGRALAAAWALYWNDLVRGAASSVHRATAQLATQLVAAGSVGSRTSGWFAAYWKDASHSCRSPASTACCSESIVPSDLSTPNTGLRHPHEHTA
jgi:flavin-dependent dehydrogenase